MTKMSIIIPVYNKEKYVSSCLNSIIHSNMKDVEIICINDHSTDHSLDIIRQFEKLDPRIKVIDMIEHHGVSWARNIGMSLAQGEYIAFVDADDVVSKNMYEDYYEYAKYYDAPIVKGSFWKIDEDEFLEHYSFETLRQKPKMVSLLNNDYEIYNESPAIWNKIYSHDFIEGITFLENHIFEDISFTYPLLLKADIMLEMQERDYYYRRTPNSILNRQEPINPKILDIIDVYKECIHLGKKFFLTPYQMNLLKGRVKKDIYDNLWMIKDAKISPEEKRKILSNILTLFLHFDPKFLETNGEYERRMNEYSIEQLIPYAGGEMLDQEDEIIKKDTLARIRKINQRKIT